VTDLLCQVLKEGKLLIYQSIINTAFIASPSFRKANYFGGVELTIFIVSVE